MTYLALFKAIGKANQPLPSLGPHMLLSAL